MQNCLSSQLYIAVIALLSEEIGRLSVVGKRTKESDQTQSGSLWSLR